MKGMIVSMISPALLKFKFDAIDMIRMYTSPVGLHPFTLGTQLTSPFKTPSTIDINQISRSKSNIQVASEGRWEHVLEALHAQFGSNRQSCLLKLSGVERKYGQVYLLK
jgi:hypothetical protein